MNCISTTWSCGVVAALALTAFGCGDNTPSDSDAANIDAFIADAAGPDSQVTDGPLPDASSACLAPMLPGPTNHQYVANVITIPTTPQQADDFALDIDGIGGPENQLGEVIALFSAQADLGIQASVDSQVANGQLLYMANVEATDLVVVGDSALRMFLGQDCDFPRDPADNFSGTELFQITGSSPTTDLVNGPIAGGALGLGPGELTLLVPISGAGNIILPVWGARLIGDIDATTISNGIIGGGIIDEDVQNILIPALHIAISTQVADSCTGTMDPNCNCDPKTSGQSLLNLFDSDGNCVISFEEVSENVLLSAFLSPDMDLFDSNNGDAFDPNQDGVDDSVSIGIGFAMVGAQFELR